MKVNSKLMGFNAGTMILMADGSEKAIENIQTGDQVMSFDQLNAFGELEPKRVVDAFMRLDRNPLYVKINDSDIELTVAPGQLFINPGSDWNDAVNINEIIDKDGNVHDFSVSQITRGKFQMYDIIVEDNHSLIANGVRVHNMTYSQEDVANGRDQVDSGAANNYHRRDHKESNKHYNSGKNKKKKAKKHRDYRPEPKIDGIVSGAKIISSTADLVDALDDIINVTTPTNLTPLKSAIQTSIDTVVNYLATFYAAVFSSSMADYDKQEVLTYSSIMTSAAIEMRNPFEEATVTASGKTQAISQLTVLKLMIVKINNTLETYVSATAEDRGYFDVDVNGQKVPKSNRGSAGSRNSNGRYNTARPEGGARNDFGSDRGRGGGKLGAGPSQTRTTGGGGNGGVNNPGPGQKTRDTKGQGTKTSPTAGQNRDSQRAEQSANRSDSAARSRAEQSSRANNYSGGLSTRQQAEQSSRALGGYGNRDSGGGVKTGTSTGSTSGGGCFAYGTMFKMADGSLKPIQDIRIGDIMLEGGQVEIVLQGDGYTQDWYSYNDVLVTGSHPVLDTDGTWKRVEDTAIAIPVAPKDTFYSLYNNAQRMVAYNGTTFTDFLEVGFQHPLRKKIYGMEAKDLIDMLNGKLGANV